MCCDMLQHAESNGVIRVVKVFLGLTVLANTEGLVAEGDIVGCSHHKGVWGGKEIRSSFLCLFLELGHCGKF